MFSFLESHVKVILEKCEGIIKGKYIESFTTASFKKPSEWTDFELVSTMYITSWNLLNSYLDDPTYLEEKTKFTRKHIGKYLTDTGILEMDPKMYLYVILRFVWEYNLTLDLQPFNTNRICLDGALVEKLDDVDSVIWEGDNGYNLKFSWIKNVMAFEIYKEFLESQELKDAKNLTINISKAQAQLESCVEGIITNATSSIEYLDTVRTEAKLLSDRLTDVKREGNFKLLAKAFSTIRQNKKKEAIFAQCRMWFFIVLLMTMPICLFSYFFYKEITFTWLSSLRYVPLISLEVLFFYFMRLFYIEVKSLKSQLVQIDLRLNLCEFIYDYVETRDRTHSDKVNDSWKAFEALIFSPIQPNEDKIPSVMDGTDVLAELAGKILKAKG